MRGRFPALGPLEEALALLEPAERQRRATFLIDLAHACATAGTIDEACAHAHEAICLTADIGSMAKSKRLQPLRRELVPRGRAERGDLVREPVQVHCHVQAARLVVVSRDLPR